MNNRDKLDLINTLKNHNKNFDSMVDFWCNYTGSKYSNEHKSLVEKFYMEKCIDIIKDTHTIDEFVEIVKQSYNYIIAFKEFTPFDFWVMKVYLLPVAKYSDLYKNLL